MHTKDSDTLGGYPPKKNNHGGGSSGNRGGGGGTESPPTGNSVGAGRKSADQSQAKAAYQKWLKAQRELKAAKAKQAVQLELMNAYSVNPATMNEAVYAANDYAEAMKKTQEIKKAAKEADEAYRKARAQQEKAIREANAARAAEAAAAGERIANNNAALDAADKARAEAKEKARLAKANKYAQFELMNSYAQNPAAAEELTIVSNDYADSLRDAKESRQAYQKARTEYTRVKGEQDAKRAEETYAAQKEAKVKKEKTAANSYDPTTGLPKSTDRSIWDIMDEMKTFSTLNENDGQWMTNAENQDRLNDLLYELDLAQKDHDKTNNYANYGGLGDKGYGFWKFLQGLDKYDSSMRISMGKLFGQKDKAYLLNDETSMDTAITKKEVNTSGFKRFVGDVAYSIGNQLPTMVLSLGLPPGTIKAVTFVPRFMQMTGQNYAQAVNEGRPPEEAMNYALLSSLVTTTLEETMGVLGGAKPFKKMFGIAADEMDDVVKAVSKSDAVKGIFKKLTASALGEGGEEYIETILSPVIENIAYAGLAGYEKQEFKLSTKEAWYNALVGGFTGTVFEGAGLVPNAGKGKANADTKADIKTEGDVKTDPDAETKAEIPDTQTEAQPYPIANSDTKTEIEPDSEPKALDNIGDLQNENKPQAEPKRLSYNDIKTLTEADLRAYANEVNNEYADFLRKTTNFTEEQISSYSDKVQKESNPDTIAKNIDNQLNEIEEWKARQKVGGDGNVQDSQAEADVRGDEDRGVADNDEKVYEKSTIDDMQSQDKREIKTSILDQVNDKIAFTEAELKSMDETELETVMLRLAELNAQDMKHMGLPQNTETYLEQIGKIKNKSQMIGTIKNIQDELRFSINSIFLNSTKNDATINEIESDNKSRNIRERFKKSSEEKQNHIAKLLKKSTCTAEEFERYILRYAGKKAASEYKNSGNWPENLQIPKSSSVLREDGSINWDFAPENGYMVDRNGQVIKEIYFPFYGEIIDRCGPDNGRFVCPVIDGKIFIYDQRSLPFIEDPDQYHQYKVIGDFSKLQDYVQKCGDQQLIQVINAYIGNWYGKYENAVIYKGTIAAVEGWGNGSGVQYELPLPIDWLIKIKMIKKI